MRYHLWLTVAVSALAAVGVDRLSRPGLVRIRPALVVIGLLVVASIPILIYVYSPAWTEASRWRLKYHIDRYRWLGDELTIATIRTFVLALLAWVTAFWASRTTVSRRRRWMASALPVLLMADLLGAHWHDVPTVSPDYWTVPPPSAVWLKGQPDVIRIYAEATMSSGEPGYASRPVDFLAVRELLAWSLAPVWGLRTTGGQTPILSNRRLRFTEAGADLDPSRPGGPRPPQPGDPDTATVLAFRRAQLDLGGLSHILTATPSTDRLGPAVKQGIVYIHRNPEVLPRLRFLGRPVYADDERAAARALLALGSASRTRPVVEDPDQPLPTDAKAEGSARIVSEVPERIEIEVQARSAGYLFLADTYDPGWSATLDGQPVPVRPAHVAFRAVFVPKGTHTITFTYRPVGFIPGLILSIAGLVVAVVLMVLPLRCPPLGNGHGVSAWARSWPWWGLALLALIVAASTVTLGPDWTIVPQSRWERSWHRFTWGAGFEAMKPSPPPLD